MTNKDIFKNNPLGESVWSSKYGSNHSPFSFEKKPTTTVDGILIRISEKIYKAKSNNGEISSKEIYGLLKDLKKMVLGGSILYGLKHEEKLVSLSNCWVIGDYHPKDSYGTIMKYDEELVQLSKRRGGVGLDLSWIRPKDSIVHNSSLYSTGVVTFAKRYSNSILEVGQDGRRGALMLTLDISHPDVKDFIDAKANSSEIKGANISIRVDDDYMRKVIKDEYLEHKIENHEENDDFNRILDDFNRALKDVNYSGIFSQIALNARNFAEPGLQFISRIDEQVDSMIYEKAGFKPITSNPCGELYLGPYESCRLASMIVSAYVSNPFTENAEFDYEEFEKDVYKGQIILDNIIDLEIEKIDMISKKLRKELLEFGPYNNGMVEIELWEKAREKALNGRRTGLGYMGLADAFAMMGYQYGSEESILLAKFITKSFMKASYMASIDLAESRGAFPVYNEEEIVSGAKNIETILKILPEEYIEKYHKYGRRNIQNLAIAPTGSISIIAGVSSSIEPLFNIRYKRRRRLNAFMSLNELEKKTVIEEDGEYWVENVVIHPMFIKWAEMTKGMNMSSIVKLNDKEFEELFKESPYYKSTAHEINPIEKIEMQAAIQEYIDGSISNTLNLPSEVTSKEVKSYLLYAWGLGLKGITVYRDGSREGILLKNEKKPFDFIDAAKRPKFINADVHNIIVNGNNWIVIVGKLFGKDKESEKPYEIFAIQHDKIETKGIIAFTVSKNSKGNYSLTARDNTMLYSEEERVIIPNIVDNFKGKEEEVITRLLSTGLRHGINIKWLHQQLSSVTGIITDFHIALLRVLAKYIPNEETSELCPECKNRLTYEGGCLVCHSCGYSKCN